MKTRIILWMIVGLWQEVMSTFRQLYNKKKTEKKLSLVLYFFIERRGLPNVTVETKNNNSNVVKIVEGPDDVL